jgi:hypothetical protein
MLPAFILRRSFFRSAWPLFTALVVASPNPKAWVNGLSNSTLTVPLNEMSLHTTDIDSETLLSVVEHVFLPPKLPQEAPTDEAERRTDVALCHILIQASRPFLNGLSPLRKSSWARMIKMMGSLYQAARAPRVEAELVRVLSNLVIGGAPELACAVV